MNIPQDDSAATAEDFLDAPAGEPATVISDRRPRRSLRARWRALDVGRRRDIIGNIADVAVIVAILGTLVGSVFAAVAIKQHNSRVQAVARAKKMDGEVFTIKTVGWNWIGDTRLYLQNERGEDTGWVMIHSNNPLHKEVNPLYLSFTPKRYAPLPFPMKVRAHFRHQPWVEKYLDRKRTHENFTGSFLEFEVLGEAGGEVARR